mmetsp:Transcript_125413/g.362845  ORF Transcript_125413/g.362845 Transcript_125413/m.362845 type:complete len:401 (+) Transcript_125413:736-1938(+)
MAAGATCRPFRAPRAVQMAILHNKPHFRPPDRDLKVDLRTRDLARESPLGLLAQAAVVREASRLVLCRDGADARCLQVVLGNLHCVRAVLAHVGDHAQTTGAVRLSPVPIAVCDKIRRQCCKQVLLVAWVLQDAVPIVRRLCRIQLRRIAVSCILLKDLVVVELDVHRQLRPRLRRRRRGRGLGVDAPVCDGQVADVVKQQLRAGAVLHSLVERARRVERRYVEHLKHAPHLQRRRQCLNFGVDLLCVHLRPLNRGLHDDLVWLPGFENLRGVCVHVEVVDDIRHHPPLHHGFELGVRTLAVHIQGVQAPMAEHHALGVFDAHELDLRRLITCGIRHGRFLYALDQATVPDLVHGLHADLEVPPLHPDLLDERRHRILALVRRERPDIDELFGPCLEEAA